jgi:hypothetical protein
MRRHKLVLKRYGDGFCGHEYCDGTCFSYEVVCDRCNFSKPSHRNATEEQRLLEIEHNQEVILRSRR